MKTAIVYYSKHHGNTKQLLDAIAALVIWAHRSNIGRLLHGTESRFQWHTNGPGRS